MPKPRSFLPMVLLDTFLSLFKVFRHQRITPAFLVTCVIFALALIFSFLAFTPILSPFVYPLF